MPVSPLLEERFVFALQIAALAWILPWCRGLAPTPAGPWTAGDLLVMAAVVAPATLALVVLLLRARGEGLADVGLRPTGRHPLFVVAVGVAAGVLLLLLDQALGWLLSPLGLEHDLSAFSIHGTADWLGASVAGALLGGFSEELVLRGFLMTRIQGLFASSVRPRQGLLVAVVVTSVWFGLDHTYQGSLAVVSVTAMGLVLAGFTILCRRNLWPVMVAHAFVDVVAFASLAYTPVA